MFTRIVMLIAGPLLLGGCLAGPVVPALTANDPGSVLAAAVPPAKASHILDLAVAARELAPSGAVMGAAPTRGEGHHAPVKGSGSGGMPMRGMGGDDPSSTAIQHAAAQKAVYYTCVMHPQIHQDHPGNCPICGMKLIAKPVETEGQKGGAK